MINPNKRVFASRTAKMVVRDHQPLQSLHRHKPAELVFALDGPIEIIGERGLLSGTCLLVPPMYNHALKDYRGRVARIYLDIGYRRIAAWKGRGIRSDFGDQTELRQKIESFFSSKREAEAAGVLMDQWLGSWLDENQIGPACDSRVATVLAYLDSKDGSVRADRKGLAKLVSLSPTRLAAIFAEDTGMPLSRYLIWRRVKIALTLVCAGRSIATAAADAGFSDGAHFTRSCRSTYGYAPSEVVGLVLVEVTHSAFGKQPLVGQHICLAPHELPQK